MISTAGRGVDVAIDAVCMEADRSFLDKVATEIRFEKGIINAPTDNRTLTTVKKPSLRWLFL